MFRHDHPGRASAAPRRAGVTVSSEPIRVLVVEDDPVAADAHALYVGRVTGIAVASARDLAIVREGVALGVVQYVLKPFTFATLRDRLCRYAEFRAAAGEASGQHEVDRALSALRAPEGGGLPKGLSAPTLAA